VDNFVRCVFIGINVTWSVTLDGKRGREYKINRRYLERFTKE